MELGPVPEVLDGYQTLLLRLFASFEEFSQDPFVPVEDRIEVAQRGASSDSDVP